MSAPSITRELVYGAEPAPYTGDGHLLAAVESGVATVVFNRPEARNAMTTAMYAGLGSLLDDLLAADDVRVVVLRGAGDKAFVAGTDISHFRSFSSGRDGIGYEATIAQTLTRLRDFPLPTVATISGSCVGGGLGIAAACDIRLATAGSRFGVPIARTLGNVLNVQTLDLLVSQLGRARVTRMLLTGELVQAQPLEAAGFCEVHQDPFAAGSALGTQIAANAPITIRSTKAALARLDARPLPADDDLVEAAYGSRDFRSAVRHFLDKTPHTWEGR